MSVIDEALSAHATIANDYDPGRGKPPAPRLAIVTCMDPRLTNIGQMLDLADGDADMIRNAGTVIDDDSVRSLVVSTRLLDSREQIQKAKSHPWISQDVPVRGSAMTSTPGGSAKCSRTGRPSLVSKGAAASARAARGRLGAELALKLHETPDLRCPRG